MEVTTFVKVIGGSMIACFIAVIGIRAIGRNNLGSVRKKCNDIAFALAFVPSILLIPLIIAMEYLPTSKAHNVTVIEQTEVDVPDTLAYVEKAYVVTKEDGRVLMTVRVNENSDTNYYVKERYQMFGVYSDNYTLVIGSKDGIGENDNVSQIAEYIQ